MFRQLLLSFCFVLASFLSTASHIVGGVMYYDYLGGNQYRITVKVYRDCHSNGAPFDAPLPVGVFDGNNNLIRVENINFPGSTHLPVIFNNPCVNPPNDICTEEAVYSKIITLLPNTSGYILSYVRCCRGPSITNLTNPDNTGLTLVVTIPPVGTIASNSSPRFSNYPPLVLCKDQQLAFDHSATDPDGDSLVYALVSPYQGGTSLDPAPNPPGNPPYSTVVWGGGYSATSPLSIGSNVQINAQTGFLTATPTQTGLYVVGIAVKEFRNGIYIGQTIRDFLFRVVDCEVESEAVITPQTELATFVSYCQGLTVHFENQSFNGSNFHWDFGVTGTYADTSNAFAPTYTFPDDGTYQVSLILNPGWPCTDTSVQTFTVHNALDVHFTPPAAQCITNNSFDFVGTGTYDPTESSFSWDFGAHATPQSDTTETPNNIVFDTSGYLPITYSVQWGVCNNSYTDSILVYRIPSVDFTLDSGLMCVPFTAHFYDQSLSDAPILYHWNFGDGGTSNLPNPTHIYNNVGIYDVSLTIAITTGCTDTLTAIQPNAIDVKPSPTAAFIVDPKITDVFHTEIDFHDQSLNNIESWYYFNETDSTSERNTTKNYVDGGYHYPYQVVTNIYGCKDTAVRSIYVIPFTTLYIPNTFTPNGDGDNDVFIPIIKDQIRYDLKIFNRWGSLIFHTTDDTKAWDGTFKGKKSPDGTYVWQLRYAPAQDKIDKVIRGHVTLLR